MKLCVGVRDVAHLHALQASRKGETPRHCTRNAPRRAAELVAAGSLYWVMAGHMAVRQRVVAVLAEHWPDGSPCAALMLDPALIPVVPRPVRAFQGWRYLEPADAPADVIEGTDEHGLPLALRQKLAGLGLL